MEVRVSPEGSQTCHFSKGSEGNHSNVFFVDISNLAYYNGPNRSVLPYVVVLRPGNIDE